jgi:hypothetical protein
VSPKRVDGGQQAIVKVLRQLGAEWIDVSADPRAGCDGILLWRKHAYVVEIKNGDLSASRRKLTENELKTQAKCAVAGAPYLILTSPEQAVELICSIGR